MVTTHLTNYDHEAIHFAKLPEYSIDCGTDYLAVRDVPNLIAQIKPLIKILDLGCGSGLATRYLKKHFPDAFVIGADINKSMLKHAMSSDPMGLYLYLNQTKDEIFYPFLTESFDVIVCSFVVHENKTMKELESFIKNVANLLRPGGLFLAWDVYSNLFQGNWLNIKAVSPLSREINEGQQYTVKISPAHAEITGTYWSPNILSTMLTFFNMNQINVHYPIAEETDSIQWVDEKWLAPYFLLEARK